MSDPTQYDIDHAVFVRQAYRYSTVENATIKAENPDAREVTIDTNLDITGALTICNAILLENAHPRAFEIDLDGTIDGDPFANGLPSFVVNSARNGTDGVARKAFSLDIDWEKNTTSWQARG